MSDLATLFIRVDSTGVVTASRDLDKLTGASKQAENETKKATEAINAHYVKMAAAIGTAMLAVKAAWKFAELGASYEEQRGLLDNLAAKYNTTADRIVESMRRASDEMVAKSELMRIALGGIAKGLNPDQLTNLSNAAKILADTTGTTTTNALNKLTEALEANRIRGVIKLAGANVDLGDTFGKLESKMTAAQKTQALYLLLIQYTNGLQAQQKKQVSGVADEMEKLTAEYADATLEIGKMAMNLVVWANAARKGIMEIVTLNPNRYAKVKDALANTGELSVEKTAENIKKQIADLIKEINAGQKNIKLGGVSKSKTKDNTEKLLDAKYKRELELAKANYDAEEQMRKDAEDGAKESIHRLMRLEQERLDSAMFLYSELSGYEDKYRELVYASIDAEAKARNELYKDDVAWAKWAAEQKGKFEYKLFKEKTDSLAQGFGDLSSAFSGISQMYAEGSAEAEKWKQASEAMIIVQKALAVVQAVGAIATQGLGDPYTAFVRIAAMAAAMGALLASIGQSINQPSGGASAKPLYGDTAVMGGEYGQESESLTNSLETVEEALDNIFNVEDVKLTKIYNELRNLNSNIKGIMSAIYRLSASGFGLDGMQTTLTSTVNNVLQPLVSQWANVGIGFNQTMAGMLYTPWLLGQDTFANNITNWVTEHILGGEIRQIQEASGLIIDSAGKVSKYVDTRIEHGWSLFGGPGYDEHVRQTSPANQELQNLFSGPNGILTNMRSTIKNISELLHISDPRGMNWNFGKITINLANLTSEQIEKKLQKTFNDLADFAAQELFASTIGKYQKAGETLFETAARIIVDKMTVLNILEMTTANYGDDFEKRLSRFVGSAKFASDWIIQLSEELITLAGGLENLTDMATAYYDSFFSDFEKMLDSQDRLRSVFKDMGMALPQSRDAYRDVVDGLDLSNETHREYYVTLLRLSEQADDYYSSIEELLQQRSDMEIELLKLQGKAAEALARERANELNETNDLLKPLQELIYAQEDLNNARVKEITAVGNLISAHEKVVSEFKGYVDKLKSARESMQMEGITYQMKEATAAKFSFAKVLEQARLGDFSGIGTIDNSLNKMIANANSPASFRTKQEYEANFYKTYNSIAELEALTNGQLTIEEQTLNTLKEQLKVLNQIAGNSTGGEMTVAEAEAAVNAATADVSAKQTILDAASTEWTNLLAYLTAAGAAEEQKRLSDLAAKQAAEAKAIADAKAAEDARKAAEQAAAEAKIQQTVAPKPLTGFTVLTKEQLAQIPAGLDMASGWSITPMTFAEGGSFGGGYRVVGEQGPELEYTGPSQIISNDKSKFLLNYKELLQEVNALRSDLNAANFQLVKNTNKNLKITERWDAMFERWDIDGIPEERTA